jgi:hypothetical protein
MPEDKNKKLKEIKRKIWCLELKIDWLKFIRIRCVAVTPMYFLPIIVSFVTYILVHKSLEFISVELQKPLNAVFIIILFFISWYWANALDKKVEKKISLLSKKINSLYKTKSNYSN